MDNGFIELRDVESLGRFLERSSDGPVVIFKHSETCGISEGAYAEMLKLGQQKANGSSEGPAADVPIGIVSIQAAREVSNEIETRTGIEHESPQVFVIVSGKVAWSASHRAVKADAVAQAVLRAVNSKQ